MRLNIIILLLASLLMNAREGRSEPRGSLKIGVVLGLTGAAAPHSRAIQDGLELARSELESEGQRIALEFQDDHTKAADSVSSFQMLLDRGYRYFIGPTWDFQVDAVKPILGRSEAISFVPATSVDTVGGPSKHMVLVCPPRSKQIPVLSSFLKQRGVQEGLVLVPNGSWGEIHSKVFADSLNSAGARVTAEDRFDYGTDVLSLKNLLLRRRPIDSQAILATGGSAELVNLIRARNAFQLRSLLIVTADLRDALLDGALKRHDLSDNDYVIGLNIDPAFSARYESRFGRAPRMYADTAYAALRLLVDAFSKTGGAVVPMEEYANAILQNFQGPGYSIMEAARITTGASGLRGAQPSRGKAPTSNENL